MIKTFFPLIIFFFAVNLPPASAVQTATLTVTVTGVKNMEGDVLVRLHNIPDAFPRHSDKAYASVWSEVKGKEVDVVFNEVPYGIYAFVVLHDKNHNGKMDFNFFHLPREGYAFSCNAKVGLGPPSFDQAKFTVQSPEVRQLISLHY
jgi:uncharacterized protein (DUF2141 family)